MAITMVKARKLCTKAELQLFEASQARNVTSITPGRLEQKIRRARALRDKYRDLAKRQEREARGKQTPKKMRASGGSANTRLKEQLFTEALGRFQAQRSKAGATSKKKAAAAKAKRAPGRKKVVKKKAAPKKKAAKKKVAKKKPAAKKAKPKTASTVIPKPKPRARAARKKKPKSKVGRSSLAADLAAKQHQFSVGGKTRLRTHVSAQGRRRQARRDRKR